MGLIDTMGIHFSSRFFAIIPKVIRLSMMALRGIIALVYLLMSHALD